MKKHLMLASVIVLMGTGFVGVVNAYGVNAPIEPEMLISLRASQTINAAQDPGRGVIKMEGDKVVSLEFDDSNANWLSAQTALKKAFNIVISLEESPLWKPEVVPFGHHTFAYTVHVNERLVDALDRLTEASAGTVRWRLLRGKIILSAMPLEQRDGVPLIGDRRVAVDIKAESLYEAFLQLEAQYNTQYQDFALVTQAPYQQSVAFLSPPPEAGKSGMLELHCEGSLRDIVLELLSQTKKAETSYLFSISRIYKTDEMPAAFYERGDLFHFALGYGTHSYYSGPKPEDSEDDPFWFARQSEERRKRQRQYYIQNHPEVAVESDGS